MAAGRPTMIGLGTAAILAAPWAIRRGTPTSTRLLLAPVCVPGGPTSGGGGNWLSSILGSLGGLSGVLGPALQAGGALAGGAIGSNASQDASRLQSDALNRGLDLQTAQWLQQQANQAPWLQAGQQALPQLMKLAGQEPPGAFQGPPSISGAGYALPRLRPRWGPQAIRDRKACKRGRLSLDASKGHRPRNYRYTPGQTPDAGQYSLVPLTSTRAPCLARRCRSSPVNRCSIRTPARRSGRVKPARP